MKTKLTKEIHEAILEVLEAEREEIERKAIERELKNCHVLLASRKKGLFLMVWTDMETKGELMINLHDVIRDSVDCEIEVYRAAEAETRKIQKTLLAMIKEGTEPNEPA